MKYLALVAAVTAAPVHAQSDAEVCQMILEMVGEQIVLEAGQLTVVESQTFALEQRHPEVTAATQELRTQYNKLHMDRQEARNAALEGFSEMCS